MPPLPALRRPAAVAALAYAAAAHLAATTSFAYLLGFLLGARVPRAVDRGGPVTSPAVALAIDALLLAAFAVPHSVLARPWWKRAWRRAVPAALDRSTYGVVAAASLALLFWQWRPVPGLVWDARGAAALWLRGAFWAGWALCAVSVVCTNLFDLTGLRQALAGARGRAAASQPLTRRGPYAHARHPLYVGFFLALWGAPAMSAGRLLFAAGCTMYILVAVRYEERDLAAEHGAAYDAYRAEVARFGVSLPGRRARCLTLACAAALAPAALRAQPAPAPPADTARPTRPARPRHEIFPQGTLFPSLTASLKEPQFRQSLLTSNSDHPEFRTLVGHTEQGGELALYRMNGGHAHDEATRGMQGMAGMPGMGGLIPAGDPGAHAWDGMEMTIQASVAAQFDLAASKWTLLNADYTFAYPMTYRRGRDAVRFRLFHVSSHLGDRYLLLRPDARTFGRRGFRREAVELLGARTFGDSARSQLLYGGGEYAYAVTPAEMKPAQLRAGAEARGDFHRFGRAARGAWVVAAEETAVQDRAWAGGLSVRSGLEVVRMSGNAPGGRRYRALVEYYGGPATYGHFSREDRLRYVGIGCYVIP